MAQGPRRRRAQGITAPIAAVVAVLAIAMGSAAVWVAYATAPAPTESAEPHWWPGLGAVPTR